MFASIELGWLFLLLPFLGFLIIRSAKHRRQLWQKFHPSASFTLAIANAQPFLFIWRKSLILFAIACLIIGLMRPQFGERYQTVSPIGRQMFVIVDTSLSMLAEDGAKTRLDLVKYHIQQLLPKLDVDTVSLVPYANLATTYLPLTNDLSAVNLFTDTLSVGMISSSGSNIHSALSLVEKTIQSQKPDHATVLIFSDGEFSMPPTKDSLPKTMTSGKVTGIVVGIGSTSGEPIPNRQPDGQLIGYKTDANGMIVLSKRMDDQLKRLATLMNGVFIDGESSPLVAESIYRTLSQQSTHQLQEQQRVIPIERYVIPVGLAFVLLLLHQLLPKILQRFGPLLLLICLAQPMHAAHPGVEYFNNQRYSDAKDQFINALQTSPSDGRIHYNLGNTYFKLNNLDRAIASYEDALSTMPSEHQLNTLYNLGTAHLANQNFSSAIDAYKQVLAIDPQHTQTLQNIEWALRQQQQQQQQQSNDDDSQHNQNENQPQSTDESDSNDNEKNEENLDPSTQSTNDASNNNSQSTPNEQPTSPTTESFTQQQVDELIESAERDALKKRHQAVSELFQGSEW